MIEIISGWAKSLIVAVIIVTIMEMLIPNNSNKKYIKVLMGVYLIFCIISPFIKNSNAISFEDISKTAEKYIDDTKEEVVAINQKSMDMRLEKLYIEQLEKTIIADVEEIGYFVKSCKVEAVLNTDAKDAGINKIQLKVDRNARVKSSNIQVVEPVEITDQSRKNSSDKEIKKTIQSHLSEKYEINENIINIDVY